MRTGRKRRPPCFDPGMVNTEIAWAVATRPATLTLMLLTIALAWPIGRRGGATGVLFVLALGIVLAATTTGYLPYFSFGGVDRYLHGFAHPGRLVHGFAGTRERLANIVLFVPLGVFGTLLWRRPLLILTGCVALTFTIETWQGYIGRTADAADVLHNTVGAAVGVGLATLWSAATADHGQPGLIGVDRPDVVGPEQPRKLLPGEEVIGRGPQQPGIDHPDDEQRH